MAIVLTGTEQIAWWLPPLAVSGVVTGLVIGAVGALLVKKIELKKAG